MKIKTKDCKAKNHKVCTSFFCECPCHHEDYCDCFSCRIKTVGFGQVPGAYQSSHVDSKASKNREDF
jgi:hypothetical protein